MISTNLQFKLSQPVLQSLMVLRSPITYHVRRGYTTLTTFRRVTRLSKIYLHTSKQIWRPDRHNMSYISRKPDVGIATTAMNQTVFNSHTQELLRFYSLILCNFQPPVDTIDQSSYPVTCQTAMGGQPVTLYSFPGCSTSSI